MNNACTLYCIIAVLTSLLAAEQVPESPWAWYLYSLRAIAAFFVTRKAYLSVPKPTEPDLLAIPKPDPKL